MRKMKKILLPVLMGLIIMSVFTGCFAKKYTVSSDNNMFQGLGEYREGAAVELVLDIWATDTDYSFYVDGEPADVSFDNNIGYIIRFTMPPKDVRVTVDSRNTMPFEP